MFDQGVAPRIFIRVRSAVNCLLLPFGRRQDPLLISRSQGLLLISLRRGQLVIARVVAGGTTQAGTENASYMIVLTTSK